MSDNAVADWDVMGQAAELSSQGEEFALATVVWRQSPTSGHLGSRAIVTADGQLHGWIGGACAEPVVIREAQRVIRECRAELLLLGSPDQFGSAVPEGMVTIPIACQSEGALQVYVEPVVPAPNLTIVGRSPMAHTLADLAIALGWRSSVHEGADFSAADLDARSIVVVATQGHGDEEAVEQAVSASPAFIGLVASEKRGAAVLGYLADRGVPSNLLGRVHTPVGFDLGQTTHREIAVAILAELVRLRAAGELNPTDVGQAERRPLLALLEDAVDPVCHMTVGADATNHPVERDGITYYFCRVGCRDAFVLDPGTYLTEPTHVHQEA